VLVVGVSGVLEPVQAAVMITSTTPAATERAAHARALPRRTGGGLGWSLSVNAQAPPVSFSRSA
jgi:hypothetical protein